MPRGAFAGLLIFLVTIGLATKMVFVWNNAQQQNSMGALLFSSAQAQQEEKKPEDAMKAETEEESETVLSKIRGDKSINLDTPGEASLDERLRRGELPSKLLEQLRKREENIEAREQKLVRLESMLQITEKQLQERKNALEGTRTELRTLLDQYEEAQNEENARLVNIYSNIEPKKAAQIFDDLDIDIIVALLRNMSPRRIAPILAEMDPEKARLVTQILSET